MVERQLPLPDRMALLGMRVVVRIELETLPAKDCVTANEGGNAGTRYPHTATALQLPTPELLSAKAPCAEWSNAPALCKHILLQCVTSLRPMMAKRRRVDNQSMAATRTRIIRMMAATC